MKVGSEDREQNVQEPELSIAHVPLYTITHSHTHTQRKNIPLIHTILYIDVLMFNSFMLHVLRVCLNCTHVDECKQYK